jgi:hypothetical protein
VGPVDPTLAASGEILDEALASMRAAVDGVPADLLNRRPAGDQTNTIAVLAMHALSSARWWLSVAVDAQLPDRDRSSEFRYESTDGADLVRWIDAVSEDCRTLVDTDASFDPGATRRSTLRGAGEDEEVSAVWALIHAIEHLQAHVAHAQLTRQVLEAPRR